MKNNILKKKLANHEQTYGCWVTLAHPLIPEILAPAGFDWLTIDMEHTSIELNDLLTLIISIEAKDIIPLVRVGENNSNLIKRVMDAGAYGIIVPNVNSSNEAVEAVNAVKYPPIGKRSIGLYRAQGYGYNFNDYLHWLENHYEINKDILFLPFLFQRCKMLLFLQCDSAVGISYHPSTDNNPIPHLIPKRTEPLQREVSHLG